MELKLEKVSCSDIELIIKRSCSDNGKYEVTFSTKCSGLNFIWKILSVNSKGISEISITSNN
jgi:hypothetical protein